jgi:hypothetical protein
MSRDSTTNRGRGSSPVGLFVLATARPIVPANRVVRSLIDLTPAGTNAGTASNNGPTEFQSVVSLKDELTGDNRGNGDSARSSVSSVCSCSRFSSFIRVSSVFDPWLSFGCGRRPRRVHLWLLISCRIRHIAMRGRCMVGRRMTNGTRMAQLLVADASRPPFRDGRATRPTPKPD